MVGSVDPAGAPVYLTATVACTCDPQTPAMQRISAHNTNSLVGNFTSGTPYVVAQCIRACEGSSINGAALAY